MKKFIYIIPALLVFAMTAHTAKADTLPNLSDSTVEFLVETILNLDNDGLSQSEIVTEISSMVDAGNPNDVFKNKGKSSIKKINFGQFKKAMRQGSSGSDVMELQEALNQIALDLGLDFQVLITDGKFGPATSRVVKLIQAHQQLQADGVVGPKTIEKLIKFFSNYNDNDGSDDDDSNDDSDDGLEIEVEIEDGIAKIKIEDGGIETEYEITFISESNVIAYIVAQTDYTESEITEAIEFEYEDSNDDNQ